MLILPTENLDLNHIKDKETHGTVGASRSPKPS